MEWFLSFSSHDGFIHSWVGVCEFEMLCRRKQYKRNKRQKHTTVSGGKLSDYWKVNSIHLHSIFMCFYTPIQKWGKKVKDCFNMTQRTTRAVIFFNSWELSHYLLSKAFAVLDRTCNEYTLDQVSCRQPCPMSSLLS